jgi:regulator of Ty1 transposition protein 103
MHAFLFLCVVIQAAQSQSQQAGNICQQLLSRDKVQSLAEQSPKEAQTPVAPHSFLSGDREQSAPVMYTRQVSFPEKSGHIEDDPRKSAAAAVAAKLTASTSSVQMLSYVLSSLASEGVIGNPVKESSSDYPSEKRLKLENDQSSYIPPQNLQQPPVPPFPHPDSIQHNMSTASQQFTPNEPPPPPASSPPPLPPLPPMPQYQVPQFMQTAGSISSVPYSYGMAQQHPPSMPGYQTIGAPINGISPFTTPSTNSYQGFQGPDGNVYSQSSSMPMAPISRQ